MPILAAWIGSLLTSIASFFAVFLTKRVALILAAVTVLVGITATMVGAMQALIAGVSYAAPPMLLTGWGWVVPDNFDDCVVAYISALTLRWGYDWQVRVVQMKLL